jgi:transcriptional regulator of nitric oxide reductase/ferredoxin
MQTLACAITLLSVLGWPQVKAGDTDAVAIRRLVPSMTAVGAFGGTPPSAPVYQQDRVIAYIFRTRQVIASKGYSGKPLDVLVALDLDGRIVGAEILEHHEPILVIGVLDEDLENFVEQYRGRNIRDPVRVERGEAAGDDSVAAVSGATISSIVLNDTLLRSARAVARSRGILGAGKSTIDIDRFVPETWPALVADGSIRRLGVTISELQARFAAGNRRYFPTDVAPTDPNAPFLELFAALATPARVGQNLLGDKTYNRVMAQRKPGDHIVFIGGRGLYSYKGTAYRRSGVFDRIQIAQGDKTFTINAADQIQIDRLAVRDSLELREISLFILRADAGFRGDAPWRVDVAVRSTADAAGGSAVILSLPYMLPAAYLVGESDATIEADSEPIWVAVWQDRLSDVAILLIALTVLWALLFFQDALARRQRLYQGVRIGFLLFTVIWIGWYANAQLSVLNVLTFTEAIRTDFSWELFLLEPLVFILWGYVAITMIFWGRGVFCGWLCPFGALQELLNKGARYLRIPQIPIPFALHERLWPIKYIAFVALFGLSLGGLAALPVAAEIEPFKTVIILGFDRAWPYILYAVVLLAFGLFVERFFCRYLCPLGGALAFPARLRMFEWLKRRWQCGLQCHICARTCPVQAIQPNGRINPNECIHCLHCQVLHYDDMTCPPLAERRKRRDPQLTNRLIKRFEDAENKGKPPPVEPGDRP